MNAFSVSGTISKLVVLLARLCFLINNPSFIAKRLLICSWRSSSLFVSAVIMSLQYSSCICRSAHSSFVHASSSDGGKNDSFVSGCCLSLIVVWWCSSSASMVVALMVSIVLSGVDIVWLFPCCFSALCSKI